MQLPLSVGVLAAVTTCLVELLIVPIFERYRNSLSAYAANRSLRAGNYLIIGPSNPIAKYCGVGSILKTRTPCSFIAVFFRVSLKALLILSIVLWESQLSPSFQRDLVTERLEPDPTGRRNVTLLTPLPLSSHFVPNGHCQNTYDDGSPCLGNRFLRFRPEIQTKFLSECVEVIGKQNVVYYSLATFTRSGPSVVCLNGREGTDRKVFMSFHSVDSSQYPEWAWRITRLDVRDDGNTDNSNGPYRATAHIQRRGKTEVLEGYLTFAGRVHYDSFVERSAYGVFISTRNRTATTTSFAVTQSEHVCNNQIVGTWSFSENEIFCPNGTLSINYPEHPTMFEIGLKRFDIVTQKLMPFTLLDALVWIFETPISRYKCPIDGVSEIRMRYSIMPLFFTYKPGRVVSLRVGTRNETTELKENSTILVCVALTTILVYSFTSGVLFWVVSGKNKIVSDFDDPLKTFTIWRKGSTPKYQVEEMSRNMRIRIALDRPSQEFVEIVQGDLGDN